MIMNGESKMFAENAPNLSECYGHMANSCGTLPHIC